MCAQLTPRPSNVQPRRQHVTGLKVITGDAPTQGRHHRASLVANDVLAPELAPAVLLTPRSAAEGAGVDWTRDTPLSPSDTPKSGAEPWAGLEDSAGAGAGIGGGAGAGAGIGGPKPKSSSKGGLLAVAAAGASASSAKKHQEEQGGDW